MGLNAAGLTALLDDGNEFVVYVATGSGPLAANQTSGQRRPVTFGAPVNRVITATSVPLAFTAAPATAATHLLLFSAATGGTFYGAAPLGGDVAYNSAGDFRIVALSLTLRDLEAPPDAPLAPFVRGEQVGVPTNVVLAPSGGLGVSDGVESLTIRHPITGEANTFDVTVYRGRSFSSTIAPHPGANEAYLIDQCRFDVSADNFVVDNDSISTPRNDIMHPMVIYRNCEFDGNNSVNIAIVGGYMWLIDCDIRNAENGISGAYYTVVDHCNIIATTDGGFDAHSDGVQLSGLGIAAVYHSWLDGGHVSTDANSALRVGTEFSAVDDVQIYYSGLACSEVGLQLRGDSGGRQITGVKVVGCRFEPDMRYGPVDAVDVTIDEWTDVAFFDGTEIPNPTA